MKTIITGGIKLFLGGLLIHFLIHTIITYGRGISDDGLMRLVWGRKEILIILLGGIGLFFIIQQGSGKYFYRENIKPFWQWWLLLLIVSSSIIFLTLIVHKQTIGELILAVKYDLFAYGIFIVSLLLSQGIISGQPPFVKAPGKKCPWGEVSRNEAEDFGNISWTEKILSLQNTQSRYFSLLKILLILSLFRYLSLLIYPERLERLGYNLHIDNILRTAETAPQGVYKTQMRTGYIRNQSIFSGPGSRGFFLILMWPLFFKHIVDKKRGKPPLVKEVSRNETEDFGNTSWTEKILSLQPFLPSLFRLSLFLLNVAISFSRAAQGIILLQTCCLLFPSIRPFIKTLRQTRKKIFLTGLVVISVSVLFFGLSQLDTIQRIVASRYTSDSGHIIFVKQGIEKMAQSPLIGYGAASAGPGSYHDDNTDHFNPENQFLQIGIEFGLIVMILWMLLFFGCGWMMYRRTGQISWLLSRWGLGLAGIVLHSFSDTMAVYPFMLLAGLSKNVNKIEHNSP